MRRHVSVMLLFMMIAVPSIAGAAGEGEVFSKGLFVPMTVLLDGKRTGTDLVVNYSVSYSGGKWIASWEEVKIFHDTLSKKTVLLPAIWSSRGGDIKNVVVERDSASFDLVLAYGGARVVVAKGDHSSGEQPDVKASLVHFDSQSNKSTTEEWVLTDRIVLPFKEVYISKDAGNALFGREKKKN